MFCLNNLGRNRRHPMARTAMLKHKHATVSTLFHSWKLRNRSDANLIMPNLIKQTWQNSGDSKDWSVPCCYLINIHNLVFLMNKAFSKESPISHPVTQVSFSLCAPRPHTAWKPFKTFAYDLCLKSFSYCSKFNWDFYRVYLDI